MLAMQPLHLSHFHVKILPITLQGSSQLLGHCKMRLLLLQAA